MGRFDICCKSFYSRPSNFADIINGVVFGGRMVVNPDDLEECGTEIINSLRGKSYMVDIVKKWKLKGCKLLITAIENQKNVDYGMVIRNMVKESLLYEMQIDEIKSYHDEVRDLKDAEYISGISKSDMLVPVIITILYFGDKPWDGPRTLYDMVDMDEELKPFIYNYKLNLIDYHDYDDFEMFQGEVKKVFEALDAKDNEDKTREYFRKYEFIGCQTAEMIASLLGIRKLKKYVRRTERGDVVNMCKAWDDHYKSGMEEGKRRAMASKAWDDHYKSGMEEGKKQALKMIIELVKENNLDINIAASKLGMTTSELNKLCVK